jgi:hypothetical protein
MKGAAKEEEKKEVKTKKTLMVMVDKLVPDGAMNEVVMDQNGEPLSSFLVYTDCKSNNNKFYNIQVLTKGNNFYFWTRYG